MSCNNTYNSCSNIIQPVSQDCLTIKLIHGDNANVLMTFFDDSSGVEVPLDLTGYIIRMNITTSSIMGGKVLKTIGNGLSQNGNQLNINFTSDDPVYSLGSNSLKYDILFIDGSDYSHWIKGDISIFKTITK